jgi:hypothetical protein
MDFFDILIFNNVKSDFKIAFCQSSNAVSKVKMLPIYLHWRRAFGVARFDKLGEARVSTRGTSEKKCSTFYFWNYDSKRRNQYKKRK